jgi:hypothetical protein
MTAHGPAIVAREPSTGVGEVYDWLLFQTRVDSFATRQLKREPGATP